MGDASIKAVSPYILIDFYYLSVCGSMLITRNLNMIKHDY